MAVSERDYMRDGPAPRRQPSDSTGARPLADTQRTFSMPSAKFGSASWWRALAYHAREPNGLAPAFTGSLLIVAALVWFTEYAPRDSAAIVWTRPAWTWVLLLGLALGAAVMLERCCWVQVHRLGVAVGAAAGFLSFFTALSLVETKARSRPMQSFDDLLPLLPWWGVVAWAIGAWLVMGASRHKTRKALKAAGAVSLLFSGVCAASKLLT